MKGRHRAMIARECGRGEKAGGPVRRVTLYVVAADHLPSEVWDAIARPERLARWFAPVSGELRVGGRFRVAGFSVAGEAAGAILACEPARRLELEWEAAGEIGWVDIALSHYGGGGARLTFTHSVRETERWRAFGPAGIGVGWDLASYALVGHLARPRVDIDLRTMAALPESRRFLASCAESWGRLAIEAGEDPDAARAAATAAAALYADGAAMALYADGAAMAALYADPEA